MVVTTPEAIDSMLRRFNALRDLRIVVVDRSAYLSDGVRGVNSKRCYRGYDFNKKVAERLDPVVSQQLCQSRKGSGTG